MNKNKQRMHADKLLKNLKQYKSYADYYEALRDNGSVPMRKAQAVEARAVHYRETVKAVEQDGEGGNNATLLYAGYVRRRRVRQGGGGEKYGVQIPCKRAR